MNKAPPRSTVFNTRTSSSEFSNVSRSSSISPDEDDSAPTLNLHGCPAASFLALHVRAAICLTLGSKGHWNPVSDIRAGHVVLPSICRLVQTASSQQRQFVGTVSTASKQNSCAFRIASHFPPTVASGAWMMYRTVAAEHMKYDASGTQV